MSEFFTSVLKAILIDLDGTLLDSLDPLYQTYYKFLYKYGIIGTQEEFNQLIGPSLFEVVKILKKKYNLTETDVALYIEYENLLKHSYPFGHKLFNGAKDFILYAKEKQWKLAIVTSASLSFVENFLKVNHLEQLFDLLVTSTESHKSKPSPESYQKALRLLEIKPSESIAIEDSPQGIQAALSAGIPTIQITHGRSQIHSKECYSLKDWQAILQAFKKKYE